MKTNLRLLGTAIGSLPHTDPAQAVDLVLSSFPNLPVWPQLGRLSHKEDMTAQFSQNIPGVVFDQEDNRWYIDPEAEDFYEKLEEFYLDYESIVSEKNFDLLDKYGITEDFSSTISLYIDKIKENKPTAVKGQIIGPFTYGTTLVDREKRCAFYDDTLREIVVKGLTLKALWLVKKFKEASPSSIPIIFMDEPTISQYGTSAFITITKQDIISSISEIASILKENGALVGVHCCGKTDWSLITESGVDILNFDGFYFAQSLSLFSKELGDFLQRGGYIAWGMVPTLDEDALKAASVETLTDKFEEAKSYLTNKGIDEKLVIDSSLITPTCGAGSLSVELAERAMELTSNLSKSLREKYLG
ncbi:MAG: hypothetical protein ACD_20C00150G0007 [uncultured bacterium]|nr:MAG: hypothetical protein ACD_20C00150G0007 [uncultured bacterium]HBH18462.1 methionine synthase [Cyanobacteria bacterium UBA9579]